jgi:hypothetical protein
MPWNADDAADADQAFRSHQRHRHLVSRPHVADPAEGAGVGEEGNRHGFPGGGQRLPGRHDDVFRVRKEQSPFAIGQLGEETVFQGVDGYLFRACASEE